MSPRRRRHPAREAEDHVLVVHRPYTDSSYYPACDGRPARLEDHEIQPGIYPVRTMTDDDGEPLAVVDLDVLVTCCTTWRWRVFRHTEHPYNPAVHDVTWAPGEVADGRAAFRDKHHRTAATWRRVAA